jgi:hypothetical protein
MRRSRILVDSRQRQSGSPGSFVLPLKPTFEGIRSIRLLYGDLPNPATGPSGPYFNIRINELGSSTRLAGTNGRETTFLIPVNANISERCYYYSNTAFEQVMSFAPGLSLGSLSVEITRNFGASQVADDSIILLEVDHD